MEHRIPPAGHHRDVSGGWLRPAVFGGMDGLVSNAALLAGVVGGGGSTTAVVTAGLAGLAAGACSMAVGEYTSVASQSDLARAEMERERLELRRNPVGERMELVGVLRERGLGAELSERVALELGADPESLWRVHVREELGLDPDALPSPVLAAAASFGSFAVGALVPLLPYLLGVSGLLIPLLVSAVGLFLAGGTVARMTERNVWFGASRQLLLGSVAAAVTYGLGAAIGGTLG